MLQSVTSLFPMLFRIIITVVFIIAFDLYAFQAVRTLTEDYRLPIQKGIRLGFWILSLILYTLAILAMGGYFVNASRAFLAMLTGLFFAMFFAKILMVLPLLIEDIFRILYKIYSFFAPAKTSVDAEVDQGFL